MDDRRVYVYEYFSDLPAVVEHETKECEESMQVIEQTLDIMRDEWKKGTFTDGRTNSQGDAGIVFHVSPPTCNDMPIESVDLWTGKIQPPPLAGTMCSLRGFVGDLAALNGEHSVDFLGTVYGFGPTFSKTDSIYHMDSPDALAAEVVFGCGVIGTQRFFSTGKQLDSLIEKMSTLPDHNDVLEKLKAFRDRQGNVQHCSNRMYQKARQHLVKWALYRKHNVSFEVRAAHDMDYTKRHKKRVKLFKTPSCIRVPCGRNERSHGAN